MRCVTVLHGLSNDGYQGRVAVTAHTFLDVEQLKQAGASRVLMPYADAKVADHLFDSNTRLAPGLASGKKAGGDGDTTDSNV